MEWLLIVGGIIIWYFTRFARSSNFLERPLHPVPLRIVSVLALCMTLVGFTILVLR